MTYVEKGIGASILRSGLRLWDGRSLSVAAAIKVTRHNLGRPTAILHEAGHQVAFSLGWNEELAEAFRREFRRDAPEVGDAFAAGPARSPATPMRSAFAGYAAVAALHDVIAGEVAPRLDRPVRRPSSARVSTRPYRHRDGATLLRRGAMGRPCAFLEGRAPDRSGAGRRSRPPPPGGARTCSGSRTSALLRPYRAFGGRPLSSPRRPAPGCDPDELAGLSRDAGTALWTSSHWLWTESLRLLALSGYRAATEPERANEIAEQFEDWMTRLGRGVQAGSLTGRWTMAQYKASEEAKETVKVFDHLEDWLDIPPPERVLGTAIPTEEPDDAWGMTAADHIRGSRSADRS